MTEQKGSLIGTPTCLIFRATCLPQHPACDGDFLAAILLLFNGSGPSMVSALVMSEPGQ